MEQIVNEREKDEIQYKKLINELKKIIIKYGKYSNDSSNEYE